MYRLLDEDRQRVNLLACSAARHPATQRTTGSLLNDLGQNFPQLGEGIRIAKKAGHTDKHVLREILTFGGVLSQKGNVLAEVGYSANAHAALNATHDASLLVGAEIETCASLEQRGELAHLVELILELIRLDGGGFMEQVGSKSRESLSEILGKQDKIGRTA